MSYINLLRNSLLSTLILIAIQFPVAAQTETSFNKQKMNTYINKLYQNQKFMGTIAIDSAGIEVYNRSVGFISINNGDTVMANEQTVYRIGSITKTFTAVMMMQLIEEGKLSLSTTLAKYYPKIPNADSITIEHLLRHQSGIPNLSGSTIPKKWLKKPPTKQQMLDFFQTLKPEFEPGSKTSYSNINYVLLGFIIEETTDESYAAQLQKRITEPLNLRNTYYGNSIEVRQNEAASFRFDQSRWKKLSAIDMSIPGGAGGIVSTPDDLTDFIYALFEGDLVSQKSLNKMTTLEDGMGMGLYKIEFLDTFALGHLGGIGGFRSHLVYFPDRKVAMAYSANGLNYSRDDIFVAVMSIYFGSDFEIPNFDTNAIPN